VAKALIIQHDGGELSFALARLERSKLYGTRRRVALDARERPCTRAALTADGATLLVSGMTGQGHFTPDGRWVARGEMVPLNAEGIVVETSPSTLGVPQPLEGPVDPREILSLEFLSVYMLAPEQTDAPLLQALKAGTVYRLPFNFTAGLSRETGYLTANDDGVFLIVGRPVEIPWAEHSAVFVPDVAEDDDVDDLDFDQL